MLRHKLEVNKIDIDTLNYKFILQMYINASICINIE